MDGSPVLIGLLIFLVCCSAFFSASETALTSLSRIRLRNMVEENVKNADLIMRLLEDPNRLLSSILVGNNLVNNGASALTTTLAIQIFRGNSGGAGIATIVITVIILIFGEITPKTIAAQKAEKVALAVVKIISFCVLVFRPVVAVLNVVTGGLIRLLGCNPNEKAPLITEAELKTMVNVSHEEGVLELDERKMINNVFDFGDSVAKDIMVPRIDMTFLDVNASYQEIMDIFRQEKYTRYPVYEETTDNVIGIVNIKDLFLIPKDKEFKLRDYLREPYYTYEFKKTTELMVELRKTMNSVAIVLDEYGATAGLITLEDMLEEIVGEIRDEYDADEEDSIRKINPKEYVIEGAMKLDDLDDQLGLDLKSEDYDSVGGYIIGLLDHLPQAGEEVTSGNLRFVVDTVERNRIDKVHLYILDAPQKSEESEQESKPER